MKEEEYRAAKAINWSTLKHMKESPLDYRLAVDNPREAGDNARLGSFIDCALLTPELLEERYVIVPEIHGWRSKEDKEAVVNNYAHILADSGLGTEEIEGCVDLKRPEFEDFVRRAIAATGKIPIPETGEIFSFEKAMKIVEINKKKPAFMKAIEASEAIQAALFAECEVTGLPIKGLIDVITTRSITDLKTIGTLGKIWYNMKVYDYKGQLAFYDYVARLNGLAKEAYYLLFIQTTYPYKMKLVDIDPRWIAENHETNIELLKQVKECQERGEWPDGSDEIEYVEYQESDEDGIGDSEVLETEQSLERLQQPGQDSL